MEKCSPVEMRKNLMAVDELKRAGIDFVPIPVSSAAHKQLLIRQGHEILTIMANPTE